MFEINGCSRREGKTGQKWERKRLHVRSIWEHVTDIERKKKGVGRKGRRDDLLLVKKGTKPGQNKKVAAGVGSSKDS